MSELDQAIEKISEGLKDAVKKALTVEDVRMSRLQTVEFTAPEGASIYNKGLSWKGQGPTRQFVLRNQPDRFWSSLSIDLARDSAYSIDNVVVLNKKQLGPSVTKSSLTQVGNLRDLRTNGRLIVDDYIFYEPTLQRLGLGTDAPNGNFSVASLESEFIIDVDTTSTKIGTYTSDGIDIVTDDTTRISISGTGDKIVIGSNNETRTLINGKLGVNIKHSDCDIATAGPVKFQGKKQEVRNDVPEEGVYKQGDLVWNSDPKPSGYVGWICVREGTPSIWKPFGKISD